MRLPLDGAAVLTLGGGIAALAAGRVLARFGARVTLIEPPGGDDLRRSGPFAAAGPHAETGGWWLFLAAGQRSVTLDLSTRTGQRLAARIPAHVVIAPPNLGHLGAGRPLVTVSPFGGEWPHAAASSLTLAAVSGLLAVSGEPEREPLSPPGPAVQVASGLFLAVAVLDALGRGTDARADLSLAEAVTATVIYDTTAFSYHGTVRRRTAPRFSTGLVLNRTMACADGYIGLHLNTQPQWRALCEFIGRPDLADDPRFATNALRARNVAALDDIVLPWVRRHDARFLFHEGQRRRIPFALIPTPTEVRDSPHLRARGFFERVEHPVAGALTLPGAPFRIDGERGGAGRAPLLGEHQRETLAAVGLSPRAAARLRAAAVA